MTAQQRSGFAKADMRPHIIRFGRRGALKTGNRLVATREFCECAGKAEQTGEVARFDLNRLLEAGDGRFIVAQQCLDRGKAGMRLRVVRLQRDRFGIGGHRRVEPAKRLQRDTEIVMRGGELAFDDYCLLIRGGGIGEAIKRLQRGAAIIVREGIFGVDCERPIAGGDRLLVPAHRHKHLTQSAVALDVIGVLGDRSLQQFNRGLEPALLRPQRAEMKQYFVVGAIDGQKGTKDPFRLAPSSLLVKTDGILDRSRSVARVHSWAR